eukprot:15350384-Ditylum_brightwellii.AAC.1
MSCAPCPNPYSPKYCITSPRAHGVSQGRHHLILIIYGNPSSSSVKLVSVDVQLSKFLKVFIVYRGSILLYLLQSLTGFCMVGADGGKGKLFMRYLQCLSQSSKMGRRLSIVQPI